MNKVLLNLLFLGCLHSFPHPSFSPHGHHDDVPLGTVEDIVFTSAPGVAAESYGAPDDELLPAASEAVTSYGAPRDELLSAASEAVTSYGAPRDELLSAPSQAVNSYLPPADPVQPAASAPSSYGVPRGAPLSSESVQTLTLQEPPVSAPVATYGFPRDNVLSSSPVPILPKGPSSRTLLLPHGDASLTSESVQSVQAVKSFLPQADPVQPSSSAPLSSYGFPRDSPLSSESVQSITFQEPPVIAPVSSYGFPRENVLLSSPSQTISTFASPNSVSSTSAKPVEILTYSNSGPQDGNYQYAYEAENGIRQSVVGEMKVVGEEQVYTMSGSYSYPGTDGQVYVVEWYADETGYHPSAPFLPKSVEPNHPEVAAAVRQQLAAAREEEAAAAASRNNLVFLAPPQGDSLAGYGDNSGAASEVLESYGLPGYTN